MIYFATIGNSDDKLTQRLWSDFVGEVGSVLAGYADTIHGEWFSDPSSQYQNACWCIELTPERAAKHGKAIIEVLAHLAHIYEQDSIFFAEVDRPLFIKPVEAV